jgi:hypothetical protein
VVEIHHRSWRYATYGKEQKKALVFISTSLQKIYLSARIGIFNQELDSFIMGAKVDILGGEAHMPLESTVTQ